MKLKQNLLCSLALAGLVCAQPLAAAPATICGKIVGNFLVEHPLNFATLLTTLQPQLSPAVYGAIFSGAQEPRTRLIYNAGTGVMTDDVFLVNPGSVVPTPSTFNFVANRFAYVITTIDTIHTTCSPVPTLMFSGTILDGAPILGVIPTGSQWNYSFAYNIPAPTSEPIALPPTTVYNISSDSVGTGLGFQPSINATVNFVDPPAGSNTPVILWSVPPFPALPYTVSDNPYQIDVSQSFDPNGNPLTYQWSSDKTATFYPSNTSPIPLITFAGGHGTYNITVVATTEYGVTATKTVTIIH